MSLKGLRDPLRCNTVSISRAFAWLAGAFYCDLLCDPDQRLCAPRLAERLPAAVRPPSTCIRILSFAEELVSICLPVSETEELASI
jgi:hypothetical protein